MIAVENKILQLVSKHKSGKAIGLTSVCSANLYVIKAAILNAKKYNQILLIESTSNQVDQFGGYTGITPHQFRTLVFNLANDLAFPIENLILGGDHLGPNRWQNENSNSAMQKAKDQMAEPGGLCSVCCGRKRTGLPSGVGAEGPEHRPGRCRAAGFYPGR